MSKIIYYEDGAGGLLAMSPSFADRDRLSLLVTEAVYEDRLIAAVTRKLPPDEEGGEERVEIVSPERVESFIAVPEKRRLETDDEVAERQAKSIVGDYAFFPAGTPEWDEAVLARFPKAAAKIAARLAAQTLAAVEARAESMRAAVVDGASATKIAAYREKYDVAIAAIAGESWALGALSAEAVARGETPEALAALVKLLGDAWRQAGLSIDAAYQSHKRAIAALIAAGDVAGLTAYDTTAQWPVLKRPAP